MFRNQYQGGPCVEVFSAQLADGKNGSKDSKYSQWNLTGSGIKKVFDKEVKSFIFTLEGTTSATKMQLPKEAKQTLGLTQGVLVLQINVPQSNDFALELGVMDSAEQKCRLAFSTAFRETQVTPLHVKVPLALIKRAVWLNLCIDLRSLVKDNLKASTFKAIESMSVSGNCKLRRIFTMQNQVPDTTNDDDLYGIPGINKDIEMDSIPKQCQLAAGVYQLTQVINSLKLQYYEGKIKPNETLVTSRTGSTCETDMLSSSGATDAQVAYHIAFGSKVPVPVPSRRAPLKEGNLTSRCTHSWQTMDGSTDPVKSFGTCISTSGSGPQEAQVMVKPHPPRKPSSEKVKRRRPRVKSTGNDSGPASIDSGGLSDSQKAGFISPHNSNINQNQEVARKLENIPPNMVDITTDTDTDSGDSLDYKEIIKALNKNDLDDRDKENQNGSGKVYMFSSRPTCIDPGRTRAKYLRKHGLASAPARKPCDMTARIESQRRPASEHTPRSSALVADNDKDFEFSDISHLDGMEQSPQHRPSKDSRETTCNTLHCADLRNGDVQSSVNNQTRKSYNRKSLREITADELQRSGCQKPYTFTKYQMKDVTESFEQQMLLSMQREAATAEESEDESPRSQLPLGYDVQSDSSDDLSTFKSPKLLKNRSHNYQDEIKNLGKNFLIQSNPRDWADVFSPPIGFPSVNGTIQTSNEEGKLYSSSGVSIAQEMEKPTEEADTDEELDLLYDPELHYFYDPHTTKYYELITPCTNSKAISIPGRL